MTADECRKLALEKWKRGKEATANKSIFRKWWMVEGEQMCSFCKYYGFPDLIGHSKGCIACPLGDSDKLTCCKEWRAIKDYIEDSTYDPEEALRLVTAMYDRIKNVEM